MLNSSRILVTERKFKKYEGLSTNPAVLDRQKLGDDNLVKNKPFVDYKLECIFKALIKL